MSEIKKELLPPPSPKIDWNKKFKKLVVAYGKADAEHNQSWDGIRNKSNTDKLYHRWKLAKLELMDGVIDYYNSILTEKKNNE